MTRRLLLVSVLAILTACGGADSSPNTTIPGFDPPSDGTVFPVTESNGRVVHDEVIAPLDSDSRALVATVPADPHPKDTSACAGIDDSTIDSITGWGVSSTWWTCSHGWLLAMPEECGECEGVSVFRRSGSGWTDAGISCHNYNLSSTVCGEDQGGPPQDVMCAIWDNDSILAALSVSGCRARRADIHDALTKPCGDWYEWDPAAPLPFGNCVYGWRVKEYQTRLANHGYKTTTDGYFGATSALATLRYQDDNGLELTASLDGPTVESVLAD